MEFKEIVQRRRSIRKFTDEPVTDEQVKTILRAALMAPTGHSKRAWKFVVVNDRAQLQQLSKCKQAGGEFLVEAAVAVVVAYDTAATDVWIEDAAIAAVTMQYQATELGLGSCWSQIRLRADENGTPATDNISRQLGLDEQVEVLCVIGIGHPAIERKMQDEDKLAWDSVTFA